MKKIILLTLLLGVSNTVKANENQTWKCIQNNNNFIMSYPFKGYWAIIVNWHRYGSIPLAA